MEYITMPTKEDFFAYTGDRLDGKLSTDYKNQDDAIEVLFKRCYREIKMYLIYIKTTSLTDEELEDWHILIMEQAEYMLSLGDKVLTGDSNNTLSPNVPRLANEFNLWSSVI